MVVCGCQCHIIELLIVGFRLQVVCLQCHSLRYQKKAQKICAKQGTVELLGVFRCFSSNLDLDRILHLINVNNRKTKRLWTARGKKL